MPALPENSGVAESEQISSGFKRLLVLAASLVIVLIAAVLILAVTSSKTDNSMPIVTSSNQVAPIAPIAPTNTPLPGNLDLSYPGATSLKVTTPFGVISQYLSNIQDISYGAYASSDSDQQIVDYYVSLFNKAGYNVIENGAVAVEGIRYLEAIKNNLVLDIAVAPSNSWQFTTGYDTLPFKQFASQLKPGQALICFSYGITSKVVPSTPKPLPSPTPVSANSVAYLGPDNYFHTDSGAGLVSTNASAAASAVFTQTDFSPSSSQSVQLTITNYTTATAQTRAGGVGQTATPASANISGTQISVIGSNEITVVIPGDTPAQPKGTNGNIGSPGQTATPASSGWFSYSPLGNGSTPQVSNGVGQAQLDWLVSDSNGFKLDISLSGIDNPTRIPPSPSQDYGTLMDDYGHTYKILHVSEAFDPKGGLHWVAQGAALPAGIHKVTFTPGTALPFQPSTPLSLDLETFQHAKLPRAVPFPNAVLQANGLNLSISYAYFGTDRTVLAFDLDGSQLQNKYVAEGINPILPQLLPMETTASPKGIGSQAVPSNPDSTFEIVDDKGKVLSALPVDPAQIGYSPYDAPGSQTIVLSPISAGAKSIKLELSSYSLRLNLIAQSGSTTPPGQFTVSVSNLLKSGAAESVNQTVNFGDVPVQIQSEQATLDQASQIVNLTLNYKVNTPNVQDLIIQCVTCNSGGGTSIGQENTQSNGGNDQVRTIKLSFPYDPTKTDWQFEISEVTLQQTGNWQLTLPISNTNS